jgi:uncharacterized protein (TIGR01777 family)
MTRVVVTGATGLIGRAVVRGLVDRGAEVVALSRDRDRAQTTLGADVQVALWRDPLAEPAPLHAVAGADAVVHLLGEPIAQRWSAEAKRRISRSRELGTRNLVAALLALTQPDRPGVLVSQSAVGFYGPLTDQPVDESAPAGTDFLADVVRRWEAEALVASDQMRVVVTRSGLVLAPSGGALAKMLPFFRLGIGGPVAGGRQYVSWIHLDDMVGGLLFAADDSRVAGPINLAAPSAVDNAEFSRCLGKVLHRPAVLPVPSFALSLLYGEMSEIVTTGQRVVPGRLLQLDYRFVWPELGPALANVLSA